TGPHRQVELRAIPAGHFDGCNVLSDHRGHKSRAQQSCLRLYSEPVMPTIPEKYVVPDLQTALFKRLYPTVTVWNRLEVRPRRADFDRALKAEVRDALWMLTKQWQVGEFFADDAGSPT